MPAKFTIFKDKKDQFRFNLKAANGEIIATGSESYPDKNSAKKGIASIVKSAPTAEIIDDTLIKEDAKKPAKEKKPAKKAATKKPAVKKPAAKKPAAKKAAEKKPAETKPAE
jgi:uncharacterized protein YegP (UPF0339 family)